eukprot:Rhum_TRINITY_DN9829_c0_g1::Rhum_TRINITY_DN9829_c0_g1_i1::g.35507::m.35507
MRAALARVAQRDGLVAEVPAEGEADETHRDASCMPTRKRGELCKRCGLTAAEAPFCTATGLSHQGCLLCSLDVTQFPYCSATGQPHDASDAVRFSNTAPTPPYSSPRHRAFAKPTVTRADRIPFAGFADYRHASDNIAVLRAVETAVAGSVLRAVRTAVKATTQSEPDLPYPECWSCTDAPLRFKRDKREKPKKGTRLFLPGDEGGTLVQL